MHTKFNGLDIEHFQREVNSALENFHAVSKQVKAKNHVSWDDTVQPLEEAAERLDRVWSLLEHMNSVANSSEIRAAYDLLLPKVTNFHTDMMQDSELCALYTSLQNSVEFNNLSAAQQSVITHATRDFKLSGVDLPTAERAKFRTLVQKLSELENKFSNNLLDATEGWTLHIDTKDKVKLLGIPELALESAAEKAKSLGLAGWVLTLDHPCYIAVMCYAQDRDLRAQMYKAYNTRASDQGPTAGQWDNTHVLTEILNIRQQLAALLGFANYAEYSLVPKMAQNLAQVEEFVQNLALKAKPVALKEYNQLANFAKQTDGLNELAAWDVLYYSELYKLEHYKISEEELRQYFPEPRVITGLFKLVRNLYGLQIEEVGDFEKWHDSVRMFKVIDNNNQLRGYFYVDLYARDGKRGGAWMAECLSRIRFANGHLQLPTAYLNCNFTAPIAGQPGLLTHNDVITLFHEFGHSLHHVLTQVDVFSVSGMSGVAWDAVELPSQFMENWCWEWSVLQDISENISTGEQLPESEYKKLLATKNYLSGMGLIRQLEFTTFDLRIHSNKPADQNKSVQKILDEVRAELTVVPVPDFNRFQNSFSHIFAGGYAAGYYSYLWAEVLACDAFDKFKKQGLISSELGQSFMQNILEQGGSKPAMDLFVAFAGRKPEIDALLKHHAII